MKKMCIACAMKKGMRLHIHTVDWGKCDECGKHRPVGELKSHE